MSSFAHIRRVIDLSEADIEAAVESREATKALLDQVAMVAMPNTGVAKLLLVFARLASTACEWMDGDLRIELVPADEMTVFEVMTDLGAGMSERLFTPVAVKVPIDEFRRSVERLPQLIQPLVPRSQAGGRLILTATAEARRSSAPPPMVNISQESLYAVSLPPAPRSPTLTSELDVAVKVPVRKPPSSPLPRAMPVAPRAAFAVRPDADHASPPALRGLEELVAPPLSPLSPRGTADADLPDEDFEPTHAATTRGMPVAAPAPLPSEPPPAFRGFNAPGPSPLRGMDDAPLFERDPAPPKPLRLETRPGFAPVKPAAVVAPAPPPTAPRQRHTPPMPKAAQVAPVSPPSPPSPPNAATPKGPAAPPARATPPMAAPAPAPKLPLAQPAPKPPAVPAVPTAEATKPVAAPAPTKKLLLPSEPPIDLDALFNSEAPAEPAIELDAGPEPKKWFQRDTTDEAKLAPARVPVIFEPSDSFPPLPLVGGHAAAAPAPAPVPRRQTEEVVVRRKHDPRIDPSSIPPPMSPAAPKPAPAPLRTLKELDADTDAEPELTWSEAPPKPE